MADFRLSEALNFRGGVILSPLGSFNLLHDSPLNDLTARPVVSRQIIPSTLSEAGMGFFGDRDLGEEGVTYAFQFSSDGERLVASTETRVADRSELELWLEGGPPHRSGTTVMFVRGDACGNVQPHRHERGFWIVHTRNLSAARQSG